MSSQRLRNDQDTYTHDLAQSVGPGAYVLDVPGVSCTECFVADPSLRMGYGGGAGKCKNADLTDLDSELIGIARRASRCPKNHYLPTGKDACRIKNVRDCDRRTALSTEDTRLSNPPCTLRGGHNGFNRWEWLCGNPQEKAISALPLNISNRLLVKDAHRPCIPRPFSSALALPPDNDISYAWVSSKIEADTLVPHMTWQSCANIRRF